MSIFGAKAPLDNGEYMLKARRESLPESDIDELSPEDFEALLEYAAEADAKLRAELAAERKVDYERLRPLWEAQEAKRREKESRQFARESQVRAKLAAKGVSLNINGGCSCCGGAGVTLEIDGERLVDDEDFFLEMISE